MYSDFGFFPTGVSENDFNQQRPENIKMARPFLTVETGSRLTRRNDRGHLYTSDGIRTSPSGWSGVSQER